MLFRSSINSQAVNNVVFYNTPFATGWFIQCPIGSTRVLTPEGYRRVDTLPKDFKVVRKGSIYDAHILKSQKERIKGVVISSGKEIEVSLGHKFLTVDGWKEVRDLALGDKIVVQKPIVLSGESKFDEVDMYLLGYLLGDGWVSTREKEIGYSFSVDEDRMSVV